MLLVFARPQFLVRFAVLATTACGYTAGIHREGESPVMAVGANAIENTGYLITSSDVSAIPNAASAADVIRILRPEFLRPRVAPTAGAISEPPTVYVDGVPAGDISTLESVPRRLLSEIRYIEPAAAMIRFGPDNRAGVISLTTTRPR
jgi:hypothetical protein